MFDGLMHTFATLHAHNYVLICLFSLIWGMAGAVLSPCHLAALPIMMICANKHTGTESGHNAHQPNLFSGLDMRSVVLFSLGFGLAVLCLGLTCLALGEIFSGGSHYWTVPLGALMLWQGVHNMRHHGCHAGHAHGLSAIVHWPPLMVGSAYGLISGSCSVALLAPVLTVAVSSDTIKGGLLVAAFAVGHALPLILLGCSVQRLQLWFGSHEGPRTGRHIMSAGLCVLGIIMILHPFLEHG